MCFLVTAVVSDCVTLNEAEQLVAKFLADSRHKKARRNNIRNGRLGPQSDWETDLEGMSAEIAACRLLNLYPDLQTETIPVYDMVSKNGWTIDVKTTKYETGKLLAVRGKVASRSDFYMLMIGSFPKYRCAGFASAESLLSDETLTDLGRGLGHALEQNDLLTLNEWKEFFDR
jgi:hypothetical protein